MKQIFDDMYNKAQKSAYKSPWQLKEQNIDFEQDLENWPFVKKARYWPITVLMPALGRVSEISFRIKTDSQAMITILAALRYKQDKNNFPDNLQQLLQQGYIKSIPMDPYSDKPLVYKKIEGGFTLYSIGADFDDDGGVQGDIKWGEGDKGGDAVFWPIEK